MTDDRQSPIKVLVVDDSPVVRRFLQGCVESSDGLHVTGLAPDPVFARNMIGQERPDVVVLDVEMPRMDGLTFLRQVLQPELIPTLVVSSHTPRGGSLAMACLESGAVEVLPKPDATYPAEEFSRDLVELIHVAAGTCLRPASSRHRTRQPPRVGSGGRGGEVIAVGASTGGPEALRRVLAGLPRNVPPIAVVQHMPPLFTRSLAASLDTVCALDVAEAMDGERLERGMVRVAPGGRHMELVGHGERMRIRLHDGAPIHRHRPSVDCLFESVAQTAGPRAMGVLLTGMGADGAAGLGAIREAGGATVAQDEASCVVFGMPREAIRRGAVDVVAALDDITDRIVDFAERPVGEPTRSE